MATGPYRFRVTFEVGYGNEPRELDMRQLDVMAYDAMQAVYQVKVGLYKELRDSARPVPVPEGSKFSGRLTVHERKGLTVTGVEPVVEDRSG